MHKVWRDIANTSKHYQLDEKHKKTQVINEVFAPMTCDWRAYLISGPVIYIFIGEVRGSMLYHIALILLGPVLYVQGKIVRKKTPLLPEPQGERGGESGNGDKLSLLIVGDSAAAGVGVDHQQDALCGRLLDALVSSCSVSWQLLANSGDSSAQLLSKLAKVPAIPVDVVVISIGVNDVTKLVSARLWTKNLTVIAELLRTKFSAKHIYYSSVPPMHLFPALPQPLRWWLGLRARQFNQIMRAVALTEIGCTFVQTPVIIDKRFIAADGFHPGQQAYKVWAEHVAQVIQSKESAG
ncbi:SGNH/GDSL hydrolase family protein [Thalassotalea insulae]|uniref:SGNH/GDSL hydrolase family protein n=1 Tax=Thalassotalea insulae TaxID=2056778 RepID=UPI0024E0B40E|nr:SGNH/GDSL hydrolase family protein [Thalassotalea insulae]